VRALEVNQVFDREALSGRGLGAIFAYVQLDESFFIDVACEV
jgi:hypothetical protein